MSHGQKRKQGVQVREVAEAAPAEPRVQESPLYGVAMLKIAMELKKPGERDLNEILRGVLARMSIPEDEFRQFLAQNGGMLRAIAQQKKF